MGGVMTPRQWWRRAVDAAKDKRSLCLVRLGPLSPSRCRLAWSSAVPKIRHYPLMEAAVIKATSHDETRMDYKNAGRVFSWARTSPATFLRPLMWALSCRVEKTHCSAVALKSLMITHGVLLCCGAASAAVGRLPFDLSAFRDRSSWGLSAFVRAYFGFLDKRSVFLNEDAAKVGDGVAPEEATLRRVERMQDLLEVLMRVRPYGDEGTGSRLLLEAMDCVVVEIFEVYSAVCSGIAYSLVGIFGPSCSCGPAPSRSSSLPRKCNREWGAMGIRVLRRAAEQSTQLSAYFELCRELGVLNAAELPPVERIPDEDIEDLEALLFLGGEELPGTEEESMGRSGKGGGGGGEEVVFAAGEGERKRKKLGTVVTEDWVVFEDEASAVVGQVGWRPAGGCNDQLVVGSNNGLWELMMYHRPRPKQMGSGGSSVAIAKQCGPESIVVHGRVGTASYERYYLIIPLCWARSSPLHPSLLRVFSFFFFSQRREM